MSALKKEGSPYTEPRSWGLRFKAASSRIAGIARSKYGAAGFLAGVLLVSIGIAGNSHAPNLAPYIDSTGVVRTFSVSGALDLSNPFFQSLGSNGRSCASCHQASDGWSVTPAHIQARFATSQGLDPIFRTNDGANCPSADVSTVEARQSAYSMLLNKGLVRVSIGVPDTADFSVIGIEDPHNCPETSSAGLALFRRPLPSTNLPFLTTVMWDGRESFPRKTLEFNLSDQIVAATLGHAQASQAPNSDQVKAILDFEMANFTAQSFDNDANDLATQGALGGPANLAEQKFFVGINDPLGANPSDFNPSAFTLFENWANLKDSESDKLQARLAVARGQAFFNTLPITITGVAGLNDLPGLSSFVGTCTTCHNTPNIGNHSVPLAINIGVTDYPALPALDTTGLPIYTIDCAPGANPPLNRGRTFQTTDPGRALITGKCSDVGKTKGPVLRGLAARAPYFHNGSATTLGDVVDFYDQRFHLDLTQQQKQDLIAFLRSL